MVPFLEDCTVSFSPGMLWGTELKTYLWHGAFSGVTINFVWLEEVVRKGRTWLEKMPSIPKSHEVLPTEGWKCAKGLDLWDGTKQRHRNNITQEKEQTASIKVTLRCCGPDKKYLASIWWFSLCLPNHFGWRSPSTIYSCVASIKTERSQDLSIVGYRVCLKSMLVGTVGWLWWLLRPAPKSLSRNSRQCLPLATDLAETPLTSPFSCYSVNTLLFLHKQCCHTDWWSNGWPWAPAWLNNFLGHSDIGWVHQYRLVPMSVGWGWPLLLYFPTAITHCWYAVLFHFTLPETPLYPVLGCFFPLLFPNRESRA